MRPSKAELGDLSLACERLWQLDDNRAEPGSDYQINLQAAKKGFNPADVAPQPLFSWVSPELLRQRRTYALFFSLLDNYHRDTGVAERATPQQKREVSDFLDAVLISTPMQYVHACLSAKRLVAPEPRAFKDQLFQMWFQPYTRESRDDTSGFEHVFVGEVDKGRVSGFHNWIAFQAEEAAGRLNYLGHLPPRGRGRGASEYEDTGPGERLVSVQFAWGPEVKDVSSIWIGTSPEFEMALYTLCFGAGREENDVMVGDYLVKIRAYHIHSKYGDKVGSCFPELLAKVPGRASSAQAWAPATPQQPPWQSAQQPAWQPPGAPWAPQQQPLPPPPIWQQPGGHPGWQQPGGQPGVQQAGGGGQGQPGCGNVVQMVLDALVGYLKKRFGGGK
ncbi:hypothetical protein WJX81_001454 [Elliptochloris bilobata]|uniref:EndoU domain-containing protein n=1 Tax=Elliptochloris bilobata TaxID=381761 RepID=A0AAW1RRN4_9CHLO